MSFNYFITKYLNFLFIIGNILICKINVVKFLVFIAILKQKSNLDIYLLFF